MEPPAASGGACQGVLIQGGRNGCQCRLRDLPSIDQLLKSEAIAGAVERFGRPVVVDVLRKSLAEIRDKARDGGAIPPRAMIAEGGSFPSSRPAVSPRFARCST